MYYLYVRILQFKIAPWNNPFGIKLAYLWGAVCWRSFNAIFHVDKLRKACETSEQFVCPLHSCWFYVMNEYDGLMSMILKMLKMPFWLAEIFVYVANMCTVVVHNCEQKCFRYVTAILFVWPLTWLHLFTTFSFYFNLKTFTLIDRTVYIKWCH